MFASVLSEPDNSFILLDIDNASESETYYGRLNNFPHTYQFRVPEGETVLFSAQVAGVPQVNVVREVPDNEASTAQEFTEKLVQEDTPDLSLILVKEERRGVSEIGRTRAESTTWTKMKRGDVGLPLQESTVLTAELETGVYKIEVSAPENVSPYQLRINGGARGSYKELFMARSVFDTGWLSLLFQWRIYIPLLLILGFWYWRKQKKHV